MRAEPIPMLTKPLDIEALVGRALKMMSRGVEKLVAVEKVLEEERPTDDAYEALVRRGLASYVDGRLAVQKFGNPTDGPRFRGSGQVAPGKRSEWINFEAKYPALTTKPYVNSEGLTVPLFKFSATDWRALADRNATEKRNAAARERVGRLALRYLRERRVDLTSDLPEKDLASLEVAVAEAWRT